MIYGNIHTDNKARLLQLLCKRQLGLGKGLQSRDYSYVYRSALQHHPQKSPNKNKSFCLGYTFR